MSEFDEYKKKRQELVDIKKGENIGTAGEVVLPKTPKEKWENYWYHYKVHTIAAIFALIVLPIIIINYTSRLKPDVTVAVASAESLEGSAPIFDEVLASYAEDITNDGKTVAETAVLYLNPDDQEEDPEVQMANKARLMAMASNAKVVIYIVDDINYKGLTDMGVSFRDITDIAPKDTVVDGTKFKLDGSSLAKELKIEESLKNMYLCVIDDKMSDGTELQGEYLENHAKCLEFARRMMNS